MSTVLLLHSYWRWVVLLASLLALAGAAARRRSGGSDWPGRAGQFFTIALDVQVLLGLILWAGGQAWHKNVFVGYIHPAAMLVAVALAHIGRRRAGKTPGALPADLLFYAGSLVVLAVFIPNYSWHF